jgi:NCAIR mutase (PurE)-related protein
MEKIMDEKDLRSLLNQVKDGEIPVDEAVLELKRAPFEDMGFARPDIHRGIRQGRSEVIYGAGKTPPQILSISEKLMESGQKSVLITRMSLEAAEYYRDKKTDISEGFLYDELSKVGIAYSKGNKPPFQVPHKIVTGEEPSGEGKIVIATGGTSDMAVAEEAALTAEFYGNKVVRLYDVGVSGIHRLLAEDPMQHIMSARVIIAIAGMEGALPSVVGGLADVPVIAVPTSVGYGAAFGGIAALLAMLNSCASGVSVVNIDNGFGAGYLAGMINQKV